MMATADEILEKAKKEAAARAGKTTEERLAEMKAARDAKLAEEAAARQAAKKNTPSKQEQADLERGKKFAEERLAANPDTGAGGIIGSTISKWEYDPKTGKKRTPKEIIDAVTEAVLADKTSGGISLDPLTGKQRSLTPAERVNQALGQLLQNAQYEGKGYGAAYDVYQYLKKGARGGAVDALANRPELWSLGKENVGKIIDRKLFDEPGSKPTFIVDPTKNQLTPEQLKAFKESGGLAIDPVTGYQILIDEQGRYTLGEQPTGSDLSGMDFSQYTPDRKPIDYWLNKPGAAGGAGAGGSYGGGSSFSPGFNMGGDPSTLTAGDGTQFNNFSDYQSYQNTLDQNQGKRQSAYNTLYNEFEKYGLGSLVSDIKDYLINNTFDPSEFSIQLQNSANYQKRFAANKDRIKAGLAALNPAEYIALEDQYQNIMRNYGLPDNYYSKGDLGVQEGFNKLIGSDVSATELEDRIATAQQRVINSNPEVLTALKQFYPDITNGDILAYTLDPKNGLDMIKRKVTAAEIGGAQIGAGLNTAAADAEALAKAGVTKAQYAQATPFISQASQRGSELGAFYGLNPYNQGSAEAEAFNLAGGAQAAEQRRKLTGLEAASFSGSSGVGALGRDKALYGAMQGQAGLY